MFPYLLCHNLLPRIMFGWFVWLFVGCVVLCCVVSCRVVSSRVVLIVGCVSGFRCCCHCRQKPARVLKLGLGVRLQFTKKAKTALCPCELQYFFVMGPQFC